jgi:hypothetical protein
MRDYWIYDSYSFDTLSNKHNNPDYECMYLDKESPRYFAIMSKRISNYLYYDPLDIFRIRYIYSPVVPDYKKKTVQKTEQIRIEVKKMDEFNYEYVKRFLDEYGYDFSPNGSDSFEVEIEGESVDFTLTIKFMDDTNRTIFRMRTWVNFGFKIDVEKRGIILDEINMYHAEKICLETYYLDDDDDLNLQVNYYLKNDESVLGFETLNHQIGIIDSGLNEIYRNIMARIWG